MPCYEAKKSDGGSPMQWGIVRPRGKDYSRYKKSSVYRSTIFAYRFDIIVCHFVRSDVASRVYFCVNAFLINNI